MKTKLLKLMAVLVLSQGLMQCTGNNRPGPEDIPIEVQPRPGLIKGGLTSYSSCEELLKDIQEQAIAKMEATINSYGSCPNYDSYDSGDAESSTVAADASSPANSGADFTSTNIQTAGVDEPDVIKTDGNFIYVAASGGIDVFATQPELKKLKTIHLGFEDDYPPTPDLFLTNNRLIAITSDYDSKQKQNVTKAFFIDKTESGALTVSNQKQWDGSLIRARLTENVLHMALSSRLKNNINYTYLDMSWKEKQEACQNDTNALADAIAKAIAANREKILESTIGDWLPGYRYDSQDKERVACNNFLNDSSVALANSNRVNENIAALSMPNPEYSYSDRLIGLVSLKLDDQISEPQISFVRGQSYEIYATSKSLYLTGSYSQAESTIIHRIALDSNDIYHRYIGSNAVAGHINNSFSMGEHGASFSIATTVGSVSRNGESEVYNNVFVMDVSKPDMPVVGKITDIAKGETIYAARFIRDKAYIVTFKKVDPLFVIDLADPKNPQIQGELKMPGYSTYLHPLGENYLIGLGKDAEEAGSFAWFQGLKLALFDVSDGNNPTIKDESIIGGRGTESQALYDHHAFTYNPSSEILALPLSLYSKPDEGGSRWGQFQYSGVQLLKVSPDSGVRLIAEVKTSESVDDDYYSYSSPSRTLMIANQLYILDDSNLYHVDMDESYEIAKTQRRSVEEGWGYNY